RRDLPRPRRRPRLLLQQRGGVDAPERLGQDRPRALPLDAARHARRRRAGALRVRAARAGRRADAARQVKLEAPFRPAGEHIAIDLPGATALFTTRRGGVSSGPYASLNLGLTTGYACGA